jgi:tetratricopeptide (TPR) repeat protein
VGDPYEFSGPRDAREQFGSLLDEGRQEAANELLKAALRVYPDDPQLILTMAVGWMPTWPAEALALVRRALNLARGDAAIKVECAWLSYRLGDTDTMRAAVKDIDPDAPTDRVTAARLINLQGQIAWDNDDLATAERVFRRANTLAPELGDHAECLARVLAERGETAEALDVVRDGLRHLPDDPALTRVLRELGSPDAADDSTASA